MKIKIGPKKKIQKIKELLQFRKSLISELNGLDDYQKKVEKVRKNFNANGKS